MVFWVSFGFTSGGNEEINLYKLKLTDREIKRVIQHSLIPRDYCKKWRMHSVSLLWNIFLDYFLTVVANRSKTC